MAEPIPEKEIEGAYELPEGWVWARLENCVDILDGQRIPVNSKEREKRKGDIPYYGATGRVGWIDDYIFDGELLLVGEDGAPFFDKTKHVAYIIQGKSWVNNHAHVLRTIKEITSNRFLCNYLNLFDYQGFVKGTTRLKLNQGSMKNIPTPIPPLAEQHRIVAKLETLMAQVNAAKDHLAAVPPIIKRFRQSVLAAACSGRLTEDWRREHPDEEPARKLIEEILQRRLSQANTPTKKQKIKDIHSHREERDSDLLPQSWEYVALDKLCESFQYGSSKKSMPEGKIPVLRMGNICQRVKFPCYGWGTFRTEKLTGIILFILLMNWR
jgi:type I restriction enzyme S subunit